MARRKRLHGLGGTPEHHEVKAKSYFDSAVEAFDSSTKRAKAKDCFGAHDDMTIAFLRVGRASAHLEETRKSDLSMQHEALNAEERATDTYYKACVRGVSGGVAGLGARRRRSRR